MIDDTSPAKFITFYSFKGGVGRSMALINTAGILVGRGFRVLVIDMDLEAPGLSYLNPNAPDVEPSAAVSGPRPLQAGFVDLLNDAKARGEQADLFLMTPAQLEAKYTQEYHVPDELREFKDGSLRIMPAGMFDGEYARRFDQLNLRELYQDGLGEPLIRAFKKKLAESGLYDYVLIDSRTGFSDEAGICTRDLADHLMILTGLNRQNVEGTCSFLRALRAAASGNEVTFDIILSPVPNGEDRLVDEREQKAKSAFESAWGTPIELTLHIPYHPQLALTEEPHIFRRRKGYLFEAYRAIEISMLAALKHDALTVWRQARASMAESDFTRATRYLKLLVRLDDGTWELGRFLDFLDFLPVTDATGSVSAEFRDGAVALQQIASDPAGYAMLAFIVENVLCDRYPAESLLRHLEQAKLMDLAERMYARWVFAEPENPQLLRKYARFIEMVRRDSDAAESLYRRAIELSPNNADGLSEFARFLDIRRDDPEAASTYYQRALERNEGHALTLASYGRVLVGQGHVREGLELLLSSFAHTKQFDAGNLVSLLYSIWLGSLLLGQESRECGRPPGLLLLGRTDYLEQALKFSLTQGINRQLWNLNRMLDRAGQQLSPDDFVYAKALADAILDENRVTDLDQFERWRDLPLLESPPDFESLLAAIGK